MRIRGLALIAISALFVTGVSAQERDDEHVRRVLVDMTAHVLVGKRVEDVLAPALRPEQAGGAQEAQMVADQRNRERQPAGHIAHAQGAAQGGGDDS